MKTSHSISRLFGVQSVPDGEALVTSVGHVRNENER